MELQRINGEIMAKHKQRIFATADLHLAHEYAVKFRMQQFHHVPQMNSTIIGNWNTTVRSEDLVYLLGDVYLDGEYKTPEKYNYWMNQLNGEKILICGNHDNKKSAEESGAFIEVHRLHEMRYRKHYITMCHYPLECWSHSQYYKSILLYGHTHELHPIRDERRRYCVSQDSNMFHPVLLDTILEKLKQNSKLVDHHGDQNA